MKLSLDAQPITLTQILWIIVALTILVLGGLTWHYHSAYQSKSKTLKTLQQSVADKGAAEALKLKTLTAERDAKQAELDKRAKDQEKIDAIAQNGIDRLNEQLRNSTVRVRVIPNTVQRSSSTTSEAASSAADRAADEGTAYGVLPELNTERLASAIKEIETLNAAFGSCKTTLIPP